MRGRPAPAGLFLALSLGLVAAGCGAPSASGPLATPVSSPRPVASPTNTPTTRVPLTSLTATATTSLTATARPTTGRPPRTPTPSSTATSRAATATPPPPTATATATITPLPTATGLPPGRPPVLAIRPRVASVWPTATPAPLLVERGLTTDKVVAFTFDAGADRGYAPEILAYLRREGLHATFGMTGRWAAANADLVAQMVRDGHQMINHTYDHQSLTGYSTNSASLTQGAVFDELDSTDRLLSGITGSSTRPYWRAPYGDETAALRQTLANHGYPVDVRWSLDTLGWNGLSTAAITRRALDAVAPGAIYLMHVGRQSQDAIALPAIWAALAAQGYRAATIAGLLAPASGSAPAARPLGPQTYTDVDPAAAYYPAPTTTATLPLSGTVVILDPGHGGDDPGTCYPYTATCYPADGRDAAATTLDEKVATLDVCLYRLLPLLHANGAAVYLTRTTNNQNPDLESRLQLSNYVMTLPGRTTRNTAFVSLHYNGTDDPTTNYTVSLYAPGRPSTLAAAIQGAMARRLAPFPTGGDHGLDTFSGHVTRRNRAPALIAEPVFLTSAYQVVVPISATRQVTTTLAGVAAHRLRLRHVSLTVVRPAVGTTTPGRPIRPSVARVVRVDRLLLSADALTPQATATPPITATVAANVAPTPSAVAQGGEVTATLLVTGAVSVAGTPLPAHAVVLTVTGQISTTVYQKAWSGEGPWLLKAHAATLAANPDYNNTPDLPAALSTATYPYDDREGQIARALLQGLGRYLGHPDLLPAAEAYRRLRADPVIVVAPGAPSPQP